MLDSRYLASLSDDLVELYAQLEFAIKKDIFKRLSKLEKITDATLYQTQVLLETGALKKDVQEFVKDYDIKAQKKLKKLFDEAMDKAQLKDMKFYKAAKRELSEEQTQVINATIDRLIEPERTNKTYAALIKNYEEVASSLTRMTATVADYCEKKFIQECNIAYMKVSSGAFSWKTAYRSAVNELAKNAVKCGYTYTSPEDTPQVLYNYSGKTRYYSLESATRMNVLTGINQTASQQTLENCEDTETTLVEVSAHIGARDVDVAGKDWANHSAWQGKVYSLKEGGEWYTNEDGVSVFAPNFQETCGLGEPDGICGINCRHSFYPYYAGMPTEYSKGELSEMKEQMVHLDHKEITPYEAEEELRICERAIRQYKAETLGFELTKDTEDNPQYIKARNKIYTWQQKAKHITEETGIKRMYINEYIGTPDGTQPKGLKPKED